MIRAIWEYIRERKWRYISIDPDASYPAFSGSFESADADAIELCMGYGPLGRISHPQLPDGFLLAVATLSVVSPFQGDPSGTSVS